MPRMHQETKCPSCSSPLDTATLAEDLKSDVTPWPGCPTVCAYCAEALRYTDDMQLRKLTEDDIDELMDEDPFVVQQVNALQIVLKRFIGERKEKEAKANA